MFALISKLLLMLLGFKYDIFQDISCELTDDQVVGFKQNITLITFQDMSCELTDDYVVGFKHNITLNTFQDMRCELTDNNVVGFKQ